MRKYIPSQAKLIPENAQKVFSGVIYDVFQWPQTMFDGSTETFEMLRRPDTVKIVAIVTPAEQTKLKNVVKFTTLSDDALIITQQEQPCKPSFYDYPGGRMDAEDPDELTAAQRELREETGLSFTHWKLVDVKQPFTKIDWLVYTFVATGLVDQVEQQLDAGEKIQVGLASIAEIQKLSAERDSQYLRLREFTTAKTIAEIRNLPALHKY